MSGGNENLFKRVDLRKLHGSAAIENSTIAIKAAGYTCVAVVATTLAHALGKGGATYVLGYKMVRNIVVRQCDEKKVMPCEHRPAECANC